MKRSSSELLFSPSPKLVRRILARMGERLAEYRADPKYTGHHLPDPPEGRHLVELLSVAFWAGVEREEGQELRFSLALVPRAPGEGYYPLESPILFSREAIRKLANAYERSITHFGIDYDDQGTLVIWGGLQYPRDGVCVVDAIEPRTLVVRYTPETIAVLKGDSTTFLPIGHVHRMPANLITLLVSELSPDTDREDRANTALLLVDLARKIRGHGHGGLVLIVPAHDERWRQSLEQRYLIDPQFDQSSGIDALDARVGRGRLSAGLSLQGPHIHNPQDQYLELARKLSDVREAAQRRLARLALVDGALVLATDRRVIGFGAHLVRSESHLPIEEIEEWDPIERRSRGPRQVKSLGGTRHQSAANFVWDNPGAIALVISQDGRVSVFTNSGRDRVRFISGVETLFL